MLDKLIEDLKMRLQNHCDIIGKERKYRNAAVLIPIVELEGQIHILFHVRAGHIRQGGEVAFPGGMAEAEDNGCYENTAVRETSEELGIDRSLIHSIGYLGTYVAHFDVTVDVYVGSLDINSLRDLNPSEEVGEIFTVPLDVLKKMVPEIHTINMEIQQQFIDERGGEIVMLEARALGLPERYQKPNYNRKRKVYFYWYKEYTIWGMTAEMLYEFIHIL